MVCIAILVIDILPGSWERIFTEKSRDSPSKSFILVNVVILEAFQSIWELLSNVMTGIEINQNNMTTAVKIDSKFPYKRYFRPLVYCLSRLTRKRKVREFIL